MKTLYWRPQETSPMVLTLVALVAIAGMLTVEHVRPTASDLREKRGAAKLAEQCMDAIKSELMHKGHSIDQRFDPHETGMIGLAMSDVTSVPADLFAKQLSVNPNFAAAMVQMLTSAGVQRGDTIAVGWSGSFPAMNVALISAVEMLDLQPVVVASGMSSQYGANRSEFMWLDMERVLRDRELTRVRSQALTIGGAADRALGQGDEVRDAVGRLQARTDTPWLPSSRLAESIDARMSLYEDLAFGKIKAYVNIGGGIASMGGDAGEAVLQPGVNRTHRLAQLPDCVMRRFAVTGTKVIHVGQIRKLATNYGIPTNTSEPPVVGRGRLFERRRPGRTAAATLLVAIVVLLHAFVSRDYGFRVLKAILRLRLPARRPLQAHDIDASVSHLTV